MSFTEKQKHAQAVHLHALDGLKAGFKAKLERIIQRVEAELGECLAVVQGLRTAADQAAIPSTNTNAPAGWSMHEYGYAGDVCIVLPDGTYLWKDTDADHDGVGDYTEIANIVVEEGCRWGGTFKRKNGSLMGDYGHIEDAGITIAGARHEAGVA
jgi:peptidoglycan L-alanyl-D-glutamate endopeptidase CwlK